MIPRFGLCIGEDGKPMRVRFVSQRGFRVAPPFCISPMVNGPKGLGLLQGCFVSICQYFRKGSWITVEHWFHAVRREQLERQKTHPWKYRQQKWDGVKMMVLPRTDPDGLVTDSNTAIIVERTVKRLAEADAVPGSVVVRGGRQMDCDYEALARILGHAAARECFQKHQRAISS